MNILKYKGFIFLMVLVLGISGCSNFEEMNMNPNASTDMDPNLQLPTIQYNLTFDDQEWHRYFIYPAGFMQQWAADWATVEYGGKAKKQSSYMEMAWMSYYPEMIKNVVDMLARTEDNPEQTNINAISRIMKVYLFSKLTDIYGDIPYFDAATGYYSNVISPRYDTQEEIYNDFFEQLDLSAKALNSENDKILYDAFFYGDINKWYRFANSLRLRLAMRLVKVNPEKAREEAEKAIELGVMTSYDDICHMFHENVANPSTGGTGNGISNRLLANPNESTFRLTTELISYMDETKDPRITMYAGSYLNDKARTDVTQEVFAANGYDWTNITVGAYKFAWEVWLDEITVNVEGVDYDVPGTYQLLQPSKLITAYDAPYIHMSYAEVEFLMAEAAFRGWNTGSTTADHFAKGLAASVYQMTLFGAEIDPMVIDDFVAANPLTSGDELKQINSQLWVLHFLDPFETWSNWRRSGFPELEYYNYTPGENQSNGEIPRRLQYPLEEQIKNEENLQEAVDRMGSDDWLNRIWWDKK